MTEFMQGGLSVFGGATNSVEVDDFDLWSLFSSFMNECADAVDGLGCLRDHADFFDMRNLSDVIGMKNDSGLGEVTLESANFDVPLFANDYGLKALRDELGEFGVGHLDERAGGVGDLVASLLPA